MVYDEKDWGKVDTIDSKPAPVSLTTKVSVFAKFLLALFTYIRKKD